MFRKDRSRFLNSLFACLLFIFISAEVHSDHGDGDDVQTFDSDTTINIYINSDSFSDQNFPSSFTEERLRRAVLKVIANWTQITGFDLRLVLADSDSSKTEPSNNQIVIRAARSKSSGALADAQRAEGYKKSRIRFFR